jgi:hypothetical protein
VSEKGRPKEEISPKELFFFFFSLPPLTFFPACSGKDYEAT